MVEDTAIACLLLQFMISRSMVKDFSPVVGHHI